MPRGDLNISQPEFRSPFTSSFPLRQVVAETGVSPETLSEPQLMGFMADPAMKPDVLFLLRHLAVGKRCKSYRNGCENAGKWTSHIRLDDESVIGGIVAKIRKVLNFGMMVNCPEKLGERAMSSGKLRMKPTSSCQM